MSSPGIKRGTKAGLGWIGGTLGTQLFLLSWFTDQEDEDQDQDVRCPPHNKLHPNLSGTITSLEGGTRMGSPVDERRSQKDFGRSKWKG